MRTLPCSERTLDFPGLLSAWIQPSRTAVASAVGLARAHRVLDVRQDALTGFALTRDHLTDPLVTIVGEAAWLGCTGDLRWYRRRPAAIAAAIPSRPRSSLKSLFITRLPLFRNPKSGFRTDIHPLTLTLLKKTASLSYPPKAMANPAAAAYH